MQRNTGKTVGWKQLEISSRKDTRGTFHAKIGSIKDRNGKDLTEAEEIKKRGQEYIEELCKIVTMMLSLTWSQTSWSV